MLGGDVSGQTAHGLLDLMVWSSESLLAAELTREGVVRRANAALLANGPGIVGQPVHAIVTPAHRPPLDAALHGAAGGWSSLEIGLFPDQSDEPADHRVWISGAADGILLVAEPAHTDQPRVIDALLALNDELVRARRAERSLGRAERDRDHDRRLLAGWRALGQPALAGLEPDAVVDRALEAAREAVQADAVVVVHAPDDTASQVVAAAGLGAPAVVRVPGPATRAGRIAFGHVRVFEDPLTIRLVSPPLAEAGARRLAVAPVPDLPAAAVHAGWSEPRPHGEDELALLEHAGAVMAEGIALRAALAEPVARDGELRMARDIDAPGTARHWLDGRLRAVGEDTRRTAVLLTSELVTNAVRHATAPGPVQVMSRPVCGGLRVTVADPGGTNWPPEQRPPRAGFGLMLVDAMSTRWGLERGCPGTRVWFEVSERHV